MEKAFVYFRDLLLSSSRWKRHAMFWLLTVSVSLVAPIQFLNHIEVWEIVISMFVVIIATFYASYGLYVLSKRYNSVSIFVLGTLFGPSVLFALGVSAVWHLFYVKNNISPLYIYPQGIAYSLFVCTIKFSKDMYVWQQEEFLRKQQQAETELNFLKAQISPHFLFNTLNNLYGHAVAKSDLLPAMMVQLSDLLRYTIYETDKPQVPLHDELDYIRNYIALEQMRISSNSKVSFEVQEGVDMSLQIAPLILISFVENAFKHSRHTISSQLYIRGSIKVVDNTLHVDIENSYNPEVRNATLTKREGGVGLEITNKRLQMLYADRHSITVNEEHGIYKLNLQIQL